MPDLNVVIITEYDDHDDHVFDDDDGDYDGDHDDDYEYSLMRGWGPKEPAGLSTPHTPPHMEPMSLT